MWSRHARAAALVLVAVAALACRKRAAVRPAPPRSSGVDCPAPEVLARLVQEPGRSTRTDCVVYAPGFFWLGAALTYDSATAASPRLSLIYGGQPRGLFDLKSVSAQALTRIIQPNAASDLRVSVRKPSRDSRLVRIGVYGQHGGDRPQADELVVVLRLVAHAPPEVLWMGDGDQVRTTPTGCVSERTIDFEMPFGDRLEMTTAQRAHGPGGKQPCLAGPSTQQTVDFTPQPLAPSRPLTAAGAPP
jgi:hypothetical protein